MTNEIISKKEDMPSRVNNLFSSKTPKQFIQSRPGPNGQLIKYVSIGYVTNKLNEAFGPFWEFRIVDKQIGNKQIWVQGQLTVKDSKTGFSITKENFGGADIKFSSKTQLPIDIANDLKSAASDCTKKCASMFGIAADVFFKEQEKYDFMSSEVDDEAGMEISTTRILMAKLFATAAEKGFSPEDVKEKVKTALNVESMNDLNAEQLERSISYYEKL